jgi:hypothetical protein
MSVRLDPSPFECNPNAHGLVCLRKKQPGSSEPGRGMRTGHEDVESFRGRVRKLSGAR